VGRETVAEPGILQVQWRGTRRGRFRVSRRRPEVPVTRKERVAMTHTVCEPCNDCKYTDCVAVCPVECFYQDDMMLYIDPVDCIDCEACVPECPVEAIFAEANVPAQWASYTPLNAEKSAALKESGEGHITEKQDAKEGPACKKK
jgi:ferredoxin